MPTKPQEAKLGIEEMAMQDQLQGITQDQVSWLTQQVMCAIKTCNIDKILIAENFMAVIDCIFAGSQNVNRESTVQLSWYTNGELNPAWTSNP